MHDLLWGAILIDYLLLTSLHVLHSVVQLMLVLLRQALDDHQLRLVIKAQQLLECQVMLFENLMNH